MAVEENHSRRKDDRSLDFLSANFDPLRALYRRDIQPPFPNIQVFNNLAEYARAIKEGKSKPAFRPSEKPQPSQRARNLKPQFQGLEIQERLQALADGSTKVEGQGGAVLASAEGGVCLGGKVVGGGGLGEGRRWKKPMNVLDKMQACSVGPMSILYRCVEERLKLRVWTRRYKGLRSVLSGYLIAFDKHMNLALMDVDEVYTLEEITAEPLPEAEAKEVKPKKKKKKKKKNKKGPESLNKCRKEESELLKAVAPPEKNVASTDVSKVQEEESEMESTVKDSHLYQRTSIDELFMEYRDPRLLRQTNKACEIGTAMSSIRVQSEGKSVVELPTDPRIQKGIPSNVKPLVGDNKQASDCHLKDKINLIGKQIPADPRIRPRPDSQGKVDSVKPFVEETVHAGITRLQKDRRQTQKQLVPMDHRLHPRSDSQGHVDSNVEPVSEKVQVDIRRQMQKQPLAVDPRLQPRPQSQEQVDSNVVPPVGGTVQVDIRQQMQKQPLAVDRRTRPILDSQGQASGSELVRIASSEIAMKGRVPDLATSATAIHVSRPFAGDFPSSTRVEKGRSCEEAACPAITQDQVFSLDASEYSKLRERRTSGNVAIAQVISEERSSQDPINIPMVQERSHFTGVPSTRERHPFLDAARIRGRRHSGDPASAQVISETLSSRNSSSVPIVRERSHSTGANRTHERHSSFDEARMRDLSRTQRIPLAVISDLPQLDPRLSTHENSIYKTNSKLKTFRVLNYGAKSREDVDSKVSYSDSGTNSAFSERKEPQEQYPERKAMAGEKVWDSKTIQDSQDVGSTATDTEETGTVPFSERHTGNLETSMYSTQSGTVKPEGIDDDVPALAVCSEKPSFLFSQDLTVHLSSCDEGEPEEMEFTVVGIFQPNEPNPGEQGLVIQDVKIQIPLVLPQTDKQMDFMEAHVPVVATVSDDVFPDLDDIVMTTDKDGINTARDPNDSVMAPDPDDTVTAPDPEDFNTAPDPEDFNTAPDPDDIVTASDPDDVNTASAPDDIKTASDPDDIAMASGTGTKKKDIIPKGSSSVSNADNVVAKDCSMVTEDNVAKAGDVVAKESSLVTKADDVAKDISTVTKADDVVAKESSLVTKADDVAKDISTVTKADDVAKDISTVTKADDVAKDSSTVTKADDVAKDSSTVTKADDVAKDISTVTNSDDVAKDISTVTNSDDVAKDSSTVTKADDVAKDISTVTKANDVVAKKSSLVTEAEVVKDSNLASVKGSIGPIGINTMEINPDMSLEQGELSDSDDNIAQKSYITPVAGNPSAGRDRNTVLEEGELSKGGARPADRMKLGVKALSQSDDGKEEGEISSDEEPPASSGELEPTGSKSQCAVQADIKKHTKGVVPRKGPVWARLDFSKRVSIDTRRLEHVDKSRVGEEDVPFESIKDSRRRKKKPHEKKEGKGPSGNGERDTSTTEIGDVTTRHTQSMKHTQDKRRESSQIKEKHRREDTFPKEKEARGANANEISKQGVKEKARETRREIVRQEGKYYSKDLEGDSKERVGQNAGDAESRHERRRESSEEGREIGKKGSRERQGDSNADVWPSESRRDGRNSEDGQRKRERVRKGRDVSAKASSKIPVNEKEYVGKARTLEESKEKARNIDTRDSKRSDGGGEMRTKGDSQGSNRGVKGGQSEKESKDRTKDKYSDSRKQPDRENRRERKYEAGKHGDLRKGEKLFSSELNVQNSEKVDTKISQTKGKEQNEDLSENLFLSVETREMGETSRKRVTKKETENSADDSSSAPKGTSEKPRQLKDRKNSEQKTGCPDSDDALAPHGSDNPAVSNSGQKSARKGLLPTPVNWGRPQRDSSTDAEGLVKDLEGITTFVPRLEPTQEDCPVKEVLGSAQKVSQRRTKLARKTLAKRTAKPEFSPSKGLIQSNRKRKQRDQDDRNIKKVKLSAVSSRLLGWQSDQEAAIKVVENSTEQMDRPNTQNEQVVGSNTHTEQKAGLNTRYKPVAASKTTELITESKTRKKQNTGSKTRTEQIAESDTRTKPLAGSNTPIDNDKESDCRTVKIGKGKRLVFKRRHVNQLFVRGDNVVMVAFAP